MYVQVVEQSDDGLRRDKWVFWVQTGMGHPVFVLENYACGIRKEPGGRFVVTPTSRWQRGNKKRAKMHIGSVPYPDTLETRARRVLMGMIEFAEWKE